MNSSFSARRNEGFEEGKLEDIKEGKLEGVRNIARRMKDSGYNLKFITEMTGLTEEEINSIN